MAGGCPAREGGRQVASESSAVSGPPESVDIGRLMEEIKERVRQRRAAGVYSEEEVRRIAQMELEVSEALPGFREEVEHHLASLNDAWDVVAPPAVTSHRAGVGRGIVAA